MKRVFKYQLETGRTTIEMPADAQILCVGIQQGIICLWANVSPDCHKAKRTFEIAGTGNESPNGIYVGTAFQNTPTLSFPNGFVWHVFEVNN